MINIIPKHTDAQLSAHVNASEIECSCDNTGCYYVLYSPIILEKFEFLRGDCGNKPLTITSGHRCSTWNKQVGGVLKSKHLVSYALDIAVPDHLSLSEFTKKCWDLFEIVIPYKNENFVHCADNIGGFK